MSATSSVGVERVVREARPDDGPALIALVRTLTEFSAEEVEVAVELVESALAKTDDYRLVVAHARDRLVGYACFGPTPMTKGAYDLYWIATREGERGTGVGRALVDGVIDRVRSSKGRLLRVETSSREDYASTRKFYERASFLHAATIPAFYDVSDDLVIYVRYV